MLANKMVNRPKVAKDVLAVLNAVDQGLVEARVAGKGWQETYCGNVVYKTSNGYTIEVFNDCLDWDYIDKVVSPNGDVWEFPEHGTATKLDELVFYFSPKSPSFWSMPANTF